MNKRKFRIGEQVEFAGEVGEVVSTRVDTICVRFGQNTEWFTDDGRYKSWHKEPLLKLREKEQRLETIREDGC